MTEKTYRVNVSWIQSTDMLIEADTIERAKEIALELVENGRGETGNIETDNIDAFNADVVENPDKAEKELASDNTDAHSDLIAENA